MQSQTYTPDATEQALISKYDLEWKDQAGQFIVFSKRHRKKLGKFGPQGNLYSLLTEAQKATQKLEADPRYQKSKPQPVTAPQTFGVAVHDNGTAGPIGVVNEPEAPPAIITNVVLDDSGGKTKKVKPKTQPRDPGKLKFLQAFKLWLTYPDADPKVITKKLRDQGIDASDASTVMLRHMAANVVKAAIEMGFLLPRELKERREARVMQLKEETEPKNS